MSGWFKLHRAIFDNPLWTEKREYSKFEAWIDLLQLVSYKEKNKMYISGQLCEWGRGQYPISISFLCDRWGWSSKKVRTYLERAQQNKQITLNRASKWTMLTICKYELYQSQGQSEGKTEGNQGATIKEYKELEEHKRVLLDSWITYRKQLKKPLTQSGIVTLCKKLENVSAETAKAVIDKSMENGWQGLFWDKVEESNQLPKLDKMVAHVALQAGGSILQKHLDKGYTVEQIKQFANQ